MQRKDKIEIYQGMQVELIRQEVLKSPKEIQIVSQILPTEVIHLILSHIHQFPQTVISFVLPKENQSKEFASKLDIFTRMLTGEDFIYQPEHDAWLQQDNVLKYLHELNTVIASEISVSDDSVREPARKKRKLTALDSKADEILNPVYAWFLLNLMMAESSRQEMMKNFLLLLTGNQRIQIQKSISAVLQRKAQVGQANVFSKKSKVANSAVNSRKQSNNKENVPGLLSGSIFNETLENPTSSIATTNHHPITQDNSGASSFVEYPISELGIEGFSMGKDEYTLNIVPKEGINFNDKLYQLHYRNFQIKNMIETPSRRNSKSVIVFKSKIQSEDDSKNRLNLLLKYKKNKKTPKGFLEEFFKTLPIDFNESTLSTSKSMTIKIVENTLLAVNVVLAFKAALNSKTLNLSGLVEEVSVHGSNIIIQFKKSYESLELGLEAIGKRIMGEQYQFLKSSEDLPAEPEINVETSASSKMLEKDGSDDLFFNFIPGSPLILGSFDKEDHDKMEEEQKEVETNRKSEWQAGKNSITEEEQDEGHTEEALQSIESAEMLTKSEMRVGSFFFFQPSARESDAKNHDKLNDSTQNPESKKLS